MYTQNCTLASFYLWSHALPQKETKRLLLNKTPHAYIDYCHCKCQIKCKSNVLCTKYAYSNGSTGADLLHLPMIDAIVQRDGYHRMRSQIRYSIFKQLCGSNSCRNRRLARENIQTNKTKILLDTWKQF